MSSERNNYLTAELNNIIIFYPPDLKIKAGFPEIHIKLRTFLFMAWLELEGAKAIPVVSK